MKLTDEEKEICKKYSSRNERGFVHCHECPLAVDTFYSLCKSNLTKRKWKEYRGDAD